MTLIRLSRRFEIFLCAATLAGFASGQDAEEPKAFAPEELEQLVAPIALHPDAVISQVLMAATYPLEVVQADRWVKDQKPPLEGDALAKALEAQTWDPSVKSLIAFPDLLGQMSMKLDWTQKLGDAMLAQEKDVLAAVQRLRVRAKEAGHLESSKEQEVSEDAEIIIIESKTTEIVYIPTYNPTVVYGTWPYPAYPPTYYYPPHYVYPPAYGFAAGVIVGAAWGYAWGGCGWRGGHVDIDIDRNVNFNRNIDRSRYKTQVGGGGRGNWKHNPNNRQGVRYRDNKTAQRYGKQGRSGNRSSRDAYRGRSSTGGAQAGRGTGASARRSSMPKRTSPSRSTPSRSSPSRSSGSAFKGYQGRSQTTRHSSRGRSSRSSSRSSGRSSRGGRGGGRRRP